MSESHKYLIPRLVPQKDRHGLLGIEIAALRQAASLLVSGGRKQACWRTWALGVGDPMSVALGRCGRPVVEAVPQHLRRKEAARAVVHCLEAALCILSAGRLTANWGLALELSEWLDGEG